MFDFTSLLYYVLMAILCSFLFTFWLIVVWVGLIHCYIYTQEWRKGRAKIQEEKLATKDLFEQVEEFKNDFN